MDYVQRTFRLHGRTVRLLDEYSRKTGVTRTFAVEKAIMEYLAREGACQVPKEAQHEKGGGRS